MRVLLVAALMLTTAHAAAEETPRWRVGARSNYVILGAKRFTGGLMPSLEATHAWTVRESVAIAAGASLGAFGFGESARWLGVLGGPLVAVRSQPWSVPLELEGRVHVDFGRVPTCNAWGLCLLYSGLFPAAAAALSYLPSPRASLAASCGLRRVSTLGWSGFSVEPGIAGTVSW
jgi:hypothetical protein